MANEKRLIDYEQAKRATYEEIFWTESEQAVVRHFLAKLPKVDAVEVVRCKDCKYYTEQKKRCDHPCQDWDVECYDQWLEMEPSDFCSYGERREGE